MSPNSPSTVLWEVHIVRMGQRQALGNGIFGRARLGSRREVWERYVRKAGFGKDTALAVPLGATNDAGFSP
jgi:hypothetical protein